MKKIIVAGILAMTMAVAGVCSAAGEGKVLTKSQITVEKTMAVLNSTAAYAELQPLMHTDLAKKVTEADMATAQKAIKENYGVLSDFRFRAFERFDDADVIVYEAKATKQPLVVVRCFLDATGKLMDFTAFAPQTPQQQPAPAKK